MALEAGRRRRKKRERRWEAAAMEADPNFKDNLRYEEADTDYMCL